jgi:chromosomal replication initiator protein
MIEQAIKNITANHFGIEVSLLDAKTRKREVVIARQTAMVIIKEITDMSLKSIGFIFGNRDHSTVIHALTAVSDMIDTDKRYAFKIAELREKIYSRVNMEAQLESKEDQIDREFIHLL